MHINNHRSRSLTLLAAFAAMWCGSSLSAATIQVPSDVRTIQGAVDAASDGDVLIVAAGTWHETINMKGKAIVLKSADGPEATVLDGRTLPGSIVYCIKGESRETGIEGFTLRGGTGDFSVHGPGQTVGGAMYISGSSPRINDCIFENNNANLQGGAVYSVRDAHPSFTNCIFRKNTSEKGGAIFSLLSNCRFTDCTFIGNLARFSGGAIFNSSHCAPTFVSCRFLSNQALYNGGAIYDYQSHGSLSRCTFERNSAAFKGGAVYSSYRSDPVFAECRFLTPSDEIVGRRGIRMASIIQTGACCLGGGCIVAEMESCIEAGGAFSGNGSICEPTITLCPTSVEGDLNGDGGVDRRDMAVLMMLWK